MRRILKSNPAMKKQLAIETAIEAKLTGIALLVATTADMDIDVYSRRVQMANKHEYGATAGLLNLITATVLWPVDKNGAMDNISITQQAILTTLNKKCKKTAPLTLGFFDKLKDSRGMHSFVSDEHTVIVGKEPEYDRYAEMLVYLADTLGVQVLDYKLDDTSWNNKEDQAIEAVNTEFTIRAESLAQHKSEMDELESQISA